MGINWKVTAGAMTLGLFAWRPMYGETGPEIVVNYSAPVEEPYGSYLDQLIDPPLAALQVGAFATLAKHPISDGNGSVSAIISADYGYVHRMPLALPKPLFSHLGILQKSCFAETSVVL